MSHELENNITACHNISDKRFDSILFGGQVNI